MDLDAELTATANHQRNTAFDLIESAATIANLREQFRLFVIVHTLTAARAALDDGLRPQWPFQPSSEQSTTRNGSPAAYLYLYWSRSRSGRGYDSPRPKGRSVRKTYVGNRAANIELARLLSSNYRLARHLEETIERAEHALASITYTSSRADRNAAHLRLSTAEALEKELSR